MRVRETLLRRICGTALRQGRNTRETETSHLFARGRVPAPGVEMRGSPPLAPPAPLCVCGRRVYLTLPYLTVARTGALTQLHAGHREIILDIKESAREVFVKP